MQNLSVKRRATSILLVLAMLVVAVAVLLPVTTSADEPEIQNFGVQTRSALSLSTDAPTDLRFICSIGSLDYTEVGFVFSKSNANPTIGGTNCKKAETTTVYSSIDADGINKPAAENRWWVAVKLTDIPHSFFDGTLYVRAFVTDGSGTRYSDVKSTTVCAAKGHTHTIVGNPTGGTATLQTEGTVIGHCDGCNLDNVTEYDTARTPLVYDSKSPSGPFKDPDNSNHYAMFKTVGEIRGDKHFYPDASNNNQGNDLWFEYSLLWNDSFQYRDYASALSEIRLFDFRDPNTWSNYRGFYYLYLLNDDGNGGAFNTSNDCPFKGHIDYSTYKSDALDKDNAVDLTSEGNTLNGDAIGQYVAGWGSNPKQRSYSPYLWDSENQTTCGWHRLGFHYHQEVESVSGSTVTYAGYTELYIDGVKVWKVLTAMQGFSYKENKITKYKSLKENNLLLWTATAEGGVITGYTDNDNMKVEMTLDNVKQSSQSVYVVVGDVYWTCGDGFVVPVTRNDSPSSQKISLGGNDYDGGYFYSEIGDTTIYKSKTSAGEYVGEYKTLTEIRGDDHFYPDATTNGGEGRNLYFEYDFLWNDTLYNWDLDTSRSEFKVITVQKTASYQDKAGHREFYYLYFRDKNDPFFTSSDCPYAGHFDYSTYESDDLGANNAYDLTSEGNYLFGDLVGKYTAGWSVSRNGSPYIYDSTKSGKGGNGWHRIGVLVHQEASLDGDNVVYSGWTELYINGVKVWKVKTAMQDFYDSKNKVYKSLKELGLTLFTAEKSGSGLVYHDQTDDVRVGYQFDTFQGSTADAYAVFANVNWRIVDVDFDPASEIGPVNYPAAAQFTLPDGSVINGRIFYRVK